MEKIPILKINDCLLVSIQVDLYDQLAIDLQNDLLIKVKETKAKGVLIDISGLTIVDSFMGHILYQITKVTRLMDATTVVVGMQPAVAITLVELGMDLAGIHTALNVDKGFQWLRQHLSGVGS
ncbi:MAG: STAS domain-containing protein [Cyclobacteriaceae bacterium]